jgi:hypothetical protein
MVGGGSPVAGLIRPLRRLVQRETVRFWSAESRQHGGYHLRLVPPFGIKGGIIPGTVVLRRDREQEESGMLAFRGECERGFRYKVWITAHRCPQRPAVRHRMELGWIKHAEHEDDYAIEYELIMYR